MYCKLALRNVRRSIRDYGVYFLTLTLGVCLFYAFNSLDGQAVMVALRGLMNSGYDMVGDILRVMEVFSVFVAVVLAALIVYANAFLIRRRKRELGTWFLLGMTAGQVSLVLLLETGLVGLFALGAGLALGVLAAHGMSLLSVAMFALPMDDFRLNFSIGALVKTTAAFGIIFLLVMALNTRSVARAKLIDLVQGERKNEELRGMSLKRSVLLFLLGVALLGVGYVLVLRPNGILRMDGLYGVMLAAGTAGTLLIFRSLSGFVLRMTKSCPGLYYRGLNMFTLRQWMSRVHTTYLSMTVICLLLLLAIGITACSVGLNQAIGSVSGAEAPYDLTIMNYSYDENTVKDWGENARVDFEALVRKAGAEDQIAWSREVIFYYNDPEVTGLSGDEGPYINALIALSDYNALMEAKGERGIDHLDRPEPRTDNLATGGNSGLIYAVVPDEMSDQLAPRRQVICAQYKDRSRAVELDEAFSDAIYETTVSLELPLSIQWNSWCSIYTGQMGNKILVLFLGLYLGITFLLAAAAVLALQQLSQAADNVPRYGILTRLGASRRQMSASVVAQVALAFLVPLALALMHAVVGMTSANSLITQVARVDMARSAFLTAGLLVVVYGGYFLFTCLSSLRITSGKENR